MYPYNTVNNTEVEETINKKRVNKKNMQLKTNKKAKIPNNNMGINMGIDEKVLDMIIEAISDEMSDIAYYSKLIKMAKSQEEKSILSQIKMDEQKHEKIFRRIYHNITGKNIPVKLKVKSIGGNTAKEYGAAIFGELKCVEFYKKLYNLINNQQVRNMLYDIITDEQSHAIKLTYLYSLFK